MNSTILSTYKKSRKNGAPAKGALHYAKLEYALREAEYEGKIKFEWQYDDAGYEIDDYENAKYAKTERERQQYLKWAKEEEDKLNSGEWVVMGCIAYVPKTCPHCEHVIENEWETADSLWGIVCDSSGTDRSIEIDLAIEAGVI